MFSLSSLVAQRDAERWMGDVDDRQLHPAVGEGVAEAGFLVGFGDQRGHGSLIGRGQKQS